MNIKRFTHAPLGFRMETLARRCFARANSTLPQKERGAIHNKTIWT